MDAQYINDKLNRLKEERKELEEEGIDLISIPWVNKDN